MGTRNLFLLFAFIIHYSYAQTEKWKEFTLSTSSNLDTASIRIIQDFKSVLYDIPLVDIIKRLDNHHLIVRGSGDDFAGLTSWSLNNNEWKINFNHERPMTHFYIHAFNNWQLPEEYNVLQKTVLSGSTLYLVESEEEKMLDLAKSPEVTYISNKVVRPEVESRVIDMNLNPNRINKIHHEFPGLNGLGEVVSIQENRFDPDDIDLVGRSFETGLESEVFDTHANEMATIIAGVGNSFITGRGVIGSARITSSNFFPVLPDEPEQYLSNNIQTQNHSYGTVQQQEYGPEAMAFDQSTYSNKDLLHVFSSGNEGDLASSGGVYDGLVGYANLTGNIKMSKNSLVVGSVDTVGNAISFVSRGPAYDGRVKPEIVAYSMAGSSNSAALVSGAATILQQQYFEQFEKNMPAALTKALLINAAEDVGSIGLDFITGYGNINAYKSLTNLRNGQFFESALKQGQTISFPLILPFNAVNLKVTLVWVDPPANPEDFQALVNDLDLKLIDESDLETLPWVLDSSPNEDALSSLAVRAVDRLNNVEQVTIDDPSTSYTISVEGFKILERQEFYVSYSYELENFFVWDYPTGSDNIPYNGETGSYFRWSSTFKGTGILSYSTDGGINWIVLDDKVNLEKEHWRWNNPPALNRSAIARMTVGNQAYETDVFTISTPLSTSVGFNCADSVMLRWDSSPNASNYEIYRMGDKELELFTTASDTFYIVHDKNSLPDTRFAIVPKLDSDQSLIITPTFDYEQQGIECYVASFFQTNASEKGIYLSLSLGTTYGVDEIIFQRNSLNGFDQIVQLSDLTTDSITFLDDSPNQGFNEHRAMIAFSNGEVLELSAGSSYFVTEFPIRIFPNPALEGDFFTIITSEYDEIPVLEIIDAQGIIVKTQQVHGTLDQISTSTLSAGIYYYKFYADGENYTGRILIR
ncbi:MAG: S8 family peptidase [Bacteroidota bacterium]